MYFIICSFNIIHSYVFLLRTGGQERKELHVGLVTSDRPRKKGDEKWDAVTVQWMHNAAGVYEPNKPNPKRALGWIMGNGKLIYSKANSSSWKPYETRVTGEEILYAGPSEKILTKEGKIKMGILRRCHELLITAADEFKEFLSPINFGITVVDGPGRGGKKTESRKRARKAVKRKRSRP